MLMDKYLTYALDVEFLPFSLLHFAYRTWFYSITTHIILSVCPTACVTGGWGEPGLETENCQSSEQAPKNAHSPSRPVHAVLGGFLLRQTCCLKKMLPPL
jgi:hypothetical protein